LISPNTPYILFYKRLSTATASATAAHSEDGNGASTSIYSSQCDSFPFLDELPVFLRDFISDDKDKYETDVSLHKNKTAYRPIDPTMRNNFDDNDPGSGSMNFDQSFAQNRFIF
jgi:hypothetical protein